MIKIFIRLVMLLAVVLTSQTASAAIEPNGVLDEVAVRFMTASATWGTVITNYAAWLFWTLGTISLVWTGGTLILKQADIREFFCRVRALHLDVWFLSLVTQKRPRLCHVNYRFIENDRCSSRWPFERPNPVRAY